MIFFQVLNDNGFLYLFYSWGKALVHVPVAHLDILFLYNVETSSVALLTCQLGFTNLLNDLYSTTQFDFCLAQCCQRHAWALKQGAKHVGCFACLAGSSMSSSRLYHLFFLAHEHNPEKVTLNNWYFTYHNFSISLSIYLFVVLIISSLGLLIHICIFCLFAPFFIKDSVNL